MQKSQSSGPSNPKFERCVALVLRSEGGFVDHPDDPGGPTNRGITLATLRDWRRQSGAPEPTVEDLRDLSVAEAKAIYLARYWNVIRGDDLPFGIDYAVFDDAVHSGPGAAAKRLQGVLGVKADGVIGRVTIAAAREADRTAVIEALCLARRHFLRSRPHAGSFPGWEKRIDRVRAEALRMASERMPAAEALRTDSVRATGAATAGVATIAAIAEHVAPTISGLAPILERGGVTALVVIGAIVVFAAVFWWRKRKD